MSFNVFRNGAWDLAQRLRVFRTTASGSPTTDWYLAKKISAWRGADPGGFWQTVYPDKPFNPVTPITTGTPVPEFTLSLNNYLIWDYSDYRTPDSPVTYQWQRSLTYASGYSDISGATGTTYTVQSADIGYYIRCRVRGTNERDFTDVFSTPPLFPVADPYYTFNFGTSLGVNANAFIMLDTVNDVFPSATQFTLLLGRILRYFTGSFSHYAIWYKSDASTFRIYHQMYRDDQSFPASPSNEVEIVFTNGSNVVDIYVVNPVTTTYINTYTAWQTGGYSIKTHPSASYAAGRKFRVTMNSLTAVSVTTEAASTTSPSAATGWIQILSGIASTDATVTFTGGGTSSSPISAGVNGAFTKSNMFFPTTPTVGTPALMSDTTALVSWTQGTANGFYVSVNRTSDNAQAYWTYTTSTSVTITGLTLGTEYTVSVSPISRGAPSYDGQFGFAGTKTWTHARPPSAPVLSLSGAPTDVGIGISWNVTWTAPNNGGSAITGYEYNVDLDADGTLFNYSDTWTSISSTTTTIAVGAFRGMRSKVKVRAINAVGTGPESAELIIPSSPTAPGTPTAGTINSTNANSSISWTASQNTYGGTSLVYSLFRGQTQTSITENRTLAINGTNTQQNLSLNDNIGGSGTTTYYYRVTPYANYGTPSTQMAGAQSSTSTGLSVTGPSANTPTVSGSNTSFSISVSWSGSAGSGSSPSYNVYRSQNSANLANLGSGNLRTNSGAITNTNLSDTGSEGNNPYYYRVDASNNIGSGASGISTGLTTFPGAPGTPNLSVANANNRVTLGWSAATSNLTGDLSYRVFRSQNGNVWNDVTGNNLVSINNTNRAAVDSYPQPSTDATYFYKVSAVNVYTGNAGGTEGGSRSITVS